MRILHFADVHLDRPFVGLPIETAQRRRDELFAAFQRCLMLADVLDVDLVTIGGDLWEEEHVTADTRNSVVFELERLDRRVLLICGNHDPLIPGGTYERVTWPENVSVVRTAEPELHDLGAVAVWGVSWTGGPLSAAFLSTFRAPDDGRPHLLLLHGTSGSLAYLTEGDTFTFQAEQVRAAGFARCLAGHVHVGSDDGTIVYPGSPEPLRWNETGGHCAALVTVTGRDVGVELMPVNQRTVKTLQLDCTGCRSSAEITAHVRALTADEDAARIYLQLELVGEIGPDCAVELRRIRSELESRFAGLALDDQTEPLLDIEARADRKGLDGLFVCRVRELLTNAHDDNQRRTLELALEAGLRAIDSRDTILHVD